MTEREGPDYVYGFNAGIQAAWERAMAMANALPVEPVTHGAKVMRDAALDIADTILELKRRAPRAANDAQRILRDHTID